VEVGPPKIQQGSLEDRCILSSGLWGGASVEIEFVLLWQWNLVATMLVIFLKINWPNWHI